MYIISFVLPDPLTEDNCIVMVTRTDDVDDAGDMAKVSLDKYHQSWFQTIFIQSGLMQIVKMRMRVRWLGGRETIFMGLHLFSQYSINNKQ